MNQQKTKQLVTIALWSIIILFAGACISLCFNNNIWTDEAFTMQLLQQDVIGIIRGTAADVHPPLYYLIAKLLQALFGPSLFVQKAASIIPAAITLIFGATKIRNLFGDKVSLLFVLVMATLPCTVVHAIQPRMYTWGLLFVTVCGVYAYEAYRESKWYQWGIMLIAGIAAAYTHYFALLSVVFMYGFLLLAVIVKKRREIKKWIVLALLSVVLYIPWLLVWIEQLIKVAADYCIPDITLKTLWSYIEFVFKTTTPHVTLLFLILFLIAAVCILLSIRKRREDVDWFALFCLLTPLLTTLGGVVLSFLIRPIFNDRYVFPAMGVLALGFAIGISKLQKPVLLAMSVFFLLTGAVQYRDTRFEEYFSTKEPETTAFFADNLSKNDIVLYNYELFGFIYENYWSKEQLVYLEDMDFTKQQGTVWFLDSPTFPEPADDMLHANHWKKEFVGMYGIEHNEFELYKLTRQ